MSYIIGIDPSLNNTGVCILYSDRPPKLLTVTAGSSTAKPLGQRLWHLQTALQAAVLPTGTSPLLAAIETPISALAVTPQNGGSGHNNNMMAYAAAYLILGKNRIPYVEVSPGQVKMIATGTGNAKKDKVVEAWNGLMIEHDSIKIDHNQVDAFFIAMAGAEVYASKHVGHVTGKPFKPYTGWLNLDDRIYDMLEKLEIQ